MKDLTKKAIAAAFWKQLGTKPISQITVKDLCADCNIHRQTFYYHFHDIYDLCFWTTTQNLWNYMDAANIAGPDEQSFLRAMFRFFSEHRQQIRHAYDALNRVQYETLLRERATPLITQRLLSYPEAAHVSQENIDFIASIYVLSLTSLFIKWVAGGLVDEYEAQLDKYCMLMDGSMRELLLKFAQ